MNLEDHSLTLGLGFSSSSFKPTTNPNHHHHPGSKPEQMVLGDYRHEPSLTLSLSGGGESFRNEKVAVVTEEPPCSAASSLVSVKREREATSSDDLDVERGGSSRISDEEEDGSGPNNTTRKKLRLTKEQSGLLEDSFKQQSTLNPKQKQALADRLNLRPRQVEVWFQNRRARTKLKQTEVDCEYLKKCCASLNDENRRLQKELQELKAMKVAQPFYMHLPAATLTMCPSCERVGAGAGAGAGVGVPSLPAGTPTAASKTAFAMGPNKSHFYTAAPNRPLLVDK